MRISVETERKLDYLGMVRSIRCRDNVGGELRAWNFQPSELIFFEWHDLLQLKRRKANEASDN